MTVFRKWIGASSLMVVAIALVHAGTQSSGGPYRIAPAVIAGGGGTTSGEAYRLSGSFGQTATTTLGASGFVLHGGFWAPTSTAVLPDPIFGSGFDP
ncbi:MAG: hypothetical protein WBV61_07900 [Rhodanobacteraceae bacterium]